MEETTEQVTPMQEKIEKLKSMLTDGDKTGYNDSDNQWKRDEKLQHKLRYLQFYEAYSVGKSAKSWQCTHCKEVEVTCTVVTYPGCSMQGKCKHKVSHKKEIPEKVSEWVCEDNAAHEKEWTEEQKSKVDVRNEIKRQFSAMLTKEKGYKPNKRTGTNATKFTKDDDIQVVTKLSRRSKPMKEEKALESTESIKESTGVQDNFHSEECKTCVKMGDLMGNILPHPINI